MKSDDAEVKYALKVIFWKNVTFSVERWSFFLFHWKFNGYLANDPTPITEQGITYTRKGAIKRLRKILWRS